MNKMKIISSVSLGVTASALFLSTGGAETPKALSSTIYSLTNETYDISYKDKFITLKFKDTSVHNSTSSIKLFDFSTNKSYTFTKNSSDFKLYLNEDLTDGIYSLIFNDKISGSSPSKELQSPVYIDFPELSNQDVYVTSLNPIISLTNLNGIYKLNARFTLLNIQDTISNARILDENNRQIGSLENITNPRNFIFNLGSSPLSLGKVYYIEYTLTNSENQNKTIKIPFTYTTNSIQINSASTNNFTYTSTKNSDNTLNLTLNFGNINTSNIDFFNANNLGFRFVPTYDSNGNVILNNIPADTIIRVEIKNNTGTQILNFKVPSTATNTETFIPFMKFVNASSLVLKQGSQITVPIIVSDLTNAGFNTPNTYIKFVYYDDFGNEIGITDEKRISSSTLQAQLTTNSNVGNLSNNAQIYVKVYTPTKSLLFPFTVSNSSTSSQSLAFDVIKNSSTDNEVSLTFRPNSSLLPSNETFSDSDLLIINNSISVPLSNDKRSFTTNISKDKLVNGTNTYTFIKSSSNGNTISFTGEFLVSTSSSNVEITNIIQSLVPTTNNQQELILRLDIDDKFLQSNLHTSIKITDELGTNIISTSSVKQIGNNRVVEISIKSPSQLLFGKVYNIEINTGTRTFNTSFIYNRNTLYNLNLDLLFNSFSTFTLKNLSTLPGYSNYDFNLKIYDYHDNSDVLYENFSQNFYGENFTTDSITRDLKTGKKFIDGNRYVVELRNATTGDVYKQTITFRESNIINQSGSNSAQINVSSGSLTYSSDSINFTYSAPQNKTITNITCSIPEIKASYSNGRIYLNGLVPSKLYRNLYLTVTFSDGTSQNIKLDDFTSQVSNDPLKNYLARVYTTTLTPINETDRYKIRYADESGFNYWYDLLRNQKISGSEFIYRILDANEFNSVHLTAQDKIRALYPIVVNRTGDLNGVNFWINEFNTTLQSVNSQDVALRVTLAKMLNEEEPKQLFRSLGIRVE